MLFRSRERERRREEEEDQRAVPHCDLTILKATGRQEEENEDYEEIEIG